MALYAGHFDFTRPLLQTVPGLYSLAECRQLLADAASAEWLPATVNSQAGRVVDAKIRDSTTMILRDDARARDLYARIAPHVPAVMHVEDGQRGARIPMHVAGIFVPLRIYRYEPGQHFGLHQDQSYAGPDGSRSLLTLMIYLNDDFEGGETDFPEQQRQIAPQAGTGLWFQHMLLHAGRRVTRGTKYVLRSDVLYQPGSHTA
ncbi:prolyl hydroxylase family protein [Corallococcus exercitus]|uniref:prolyl hydroxylase family protein n=1 Tax=Corallococcus exercitus TaxID=2316736 RepID=UPI0035D45D4E